MKNPTPEELERMAEARQASLIRKWLSGRKLAPEEKAEIAPLLPPHILAQGPRAPAAQAVIQGVLNTRKHAKYAKKLPDYAALFGQTERTIKRWIRRGKEMRNLPPLDTPDGMPGWWRACMDIQVPDYLLGFNPPAASGSEQPTARRAAASTGEIEPSAPAAAVAGAGEPAAPRDFSAVRSLDLAENVEALRHTHAINARLLAEALAGSSENLASLRQKNFERTFDLLRKAEQSLVDLQKQRGNLIARDAVEAELAQIFESLRIMRESMPRRVLAELEQVLPRRLARVFHLLEKFLLPAVEKVRLAEEEIFRNLQTLDGPEAVKELLAA